MLNTAPSEIDKLEFLPSDHGGVAIEDREVDTPKKKPGNRCFPNLDIGICDVDFTRE